MDNTAPHGADHLQQSVFYYDLRHCPLLGAALQNCTVSAMDLPGSHTFEQALTLERRCEILLQKRWGSGGRGTPASTPREWQFPTS